MEDFVLKLFENSLIGGAFVAMLFFITVRFEKALQENTKELKKVTQTLISLDKRVERLEGSEKA